MSIPCSYILYSIYYHVFYNGFYFLCIMIHIMSKKPSIYIDYAQRRMLSLIIIILFPPHGTSHDGWFILGDLMMFHLSCGVCMNRLSLYVYTHVVVDVRGKT